jgi:large subunit ribosomal protein L30
MKKVRITQIRSGIKGTVRQNRTLDALGIIKMHNAVEKELTPQIAGMIHKVKHLLKVENL